VHFLIPKTILKKRECNDFYDFWIFGTDAKHKKTEIGTEPEAPNLFGYRIRCPAPKCEGFGFFDTGVVYTSQEFKKERYA
jgi:hypothetical protein